MIHKSSFVRSVATLLTGTAIAQLIPIALSPLLTRVFDPSAMGVLGLFTSLTFILVIPATGRYELAIMLPKQDGDAANLTIFSCLLALLFSGLLLIPALLWSPAVATFLGNPHIASWLPWVAPTVFTFAVFQSFNYWLNRKESYRAMAISRMLRNGLSSACGLLLGLAGMVDGGLVVGAIAGSVMAAVLTCWSALRLDAAPFRKTSVSGMLDQGRRYIDFPKLSVVSNTLNAFSMQLPILLLTFFFSTEIAGYFSLTNLVLRTPLTMVGRAVGDVFRQRAIKRIGATGSSRELYRKTLLWLFLISLVPFSLLYLLAPSVFPLLFGDGWSEAAIYIQLMIPMYFLQFISNPLSYMLIVAERQDIDLYWQIGKALVSVLSIAIGSLVFDNAHTAIAIYSALIAALYLFNIYLSHKITATPSPVATGA